MLGYFHSNGAFQGYHKTSNGIRVRTKKEDSIDVTKKYIIKQKENKDKK